MNAEQFEILAEAYGADLSRWPGDMRQAAAEFLAANPRALDEAAALDALLDTAPALRLNADFLDRLAYGSPRPRARLGGAKTWISAAGLVAACVMGLAFGASLPSSILVDPSTEALVGTQTAFDTAAEFDLEEFG